jgi:flagellar hook-associated protein 1 FlgK
VTNLTATATATGYTLSPSLGQAALPGIEITIDLSGGKTRSAGDQFLIRPTYDAAQKIGLNINDPDKIAAATNIELDPVTRLPVSPVSIIKGPMPGDNSNALKLAALENKLTMTGGHATLKDTYGQIVSSVGTLTQAAEVGSSAQQTLLNQAKGARESLVGVNLDEEAANLIKFQQAYQASAQSISVARSLFDTLIGAVR